MKIFKHQLLTSWRYKIAMFVIALAGPLMVGMAYAQTAEAAVYICNKNGNNFCASSDGVLYDHIKLQNNGTQWYREDINEKYNGYELYRLQLDSDNADCIGLRASDGSAVLKNCTTDNYVDWYYQTQPDGSRYWLNADWGNGGVLTSDNAAGDNLWVTFAGGNGHYQEWNN